MAVTIKVRSEHPHSAFSELVQVGSWRLDQLVGEGRWTHVFQARPAGRQGQWPSDYAVKLPKGGDREQPLALQMLHRELEIGRSLVHPHLVSVLDGQLTEQPHLVMPYLEGAVLSRVLGGTPGLAPPYALWLIRQVAEALVALRTAGWIHADVKPDNVIVSRRGHATLIDLGLARQLKSAECQPGGPLVGTLDYMAPEMISSSTPIGDRVDVYSLGATLYHLLTGHKPFEGKSGQQLAAAHVALAIPNARRSAPHLSNSTTRLLTSMLAKQPLRRPTMSEVVDTLMDVEIETLDDRQLH